MEALVLEPNRKLALREMDLDEPLGPHDVRIALRTVGVCGSDVHYYAHGRIGLHIVRDPMILGHEAAGKIIEAGSAVTHLHIGDRVCMEPGILDPQSKATRLGCYNLDPAVRFWATQLDVGINLKGVAPLKRLDPSGRFNEMVSHRVRLSRMDEVDEELLGWPRQAYDAA